MLWFYVTHYVSVITDWPTLGKNHSSQLDYIKNLILYSFPSLLQPKGIGSENAIKAVVMSGLANHINRVMSQEKIEQTLNTNHLGFIEQWCGEGSLFSALSVSRVNSYSPEAMSISSSALTYLLTPIMWPVANTSGQHCSQDTLTCIFFFHINWCMTRYSSQLDVAEYSHQLTHTFTCVHKVIQ